MENFNPSINNNDSSISLLEKIKKNLSGPKIIFIILGVVLLVEVVYAVRVFSRPSPSPAPVKKDVTVKTSGGKISLYSPKRAFKVAEKVPVSVVISTGGNSVDGVDLILRFDPKVLEATSGGLVKGKILDEYPLISIDEKKGIISISGISSKNGYNGTGQFASLTFKAKSAGNTTLTVDYIKDSTTDSNLVESAASKDVLEAVENLELNIN